ncbi:TonB-dependent receptor [Ravibacter arvi]
MQLTFCQLILLAFFGNLAAGGILPGQSLLDKKVTLNLKNVGLGEVLSELEKNTSVKFIYSQEQIKASRKVSFSSRNENLRTALTRLLVPLEIEYNVMASRIVLKSAREKESETKLLNDASVDKTIKGKVTDEKGDPMIGVNVLAKGTSAGTSTDVNGEFSLNVPDQATTLVISFIGYMAQEVSIDSRTRVDITMKEDNQSLSEVVVVGYGSQLKREVTGSVQTVKAEDIKDLPVAQVTQKLQGRLAGVQINQATGKPGQGMSVRIRGQVSVSAGSDPLYVIDGFPITGTIGNINPDEIEDISILKDAASTSLYGSRAANGVVLITTKTAKPGKTNVTFSAYYGTQKVPMKGRLEMMNAEEFALFKKQSFEDAGDPVPEIFSDPAKYRSKNNDWYDAVLRRAPIQSYNLTVASHKEKMSSTLVAGIFNQQGVVINNEYKRYTLRLNNKYDLTDKLSIGFNIAPQYVFDNTPRTDGDRGTGILFNALHTWPIMPIRDANGDLTLYNTLPGATGNIYNYPNWVRAAKELTNETRDINLLGNAYVQFEPIKGLKLRSSLNVEYLNRKWFFFNPSTATSAMNVPVPTTAVSTRQSLENMGWLNENLATYNKSIGDHNFEILAGFTMQRFRQEFARIQGDTYADDRLPTIQGALNIARGGTLNGINEWTLASYISRLTYNYKGKYLFTAAVRADGSSRFGISNQWGTFPSASVGWVLSDEAFMESVRPVSFAKFRASYGVIGNNNLGNYTQRALINSTVNVAFGDRVHTGAAVTSIANPHLGWETTHQFDAGLDLGLFNDRIQFIYDFYTKRTTNLLYNVQLPQESGFSFFPDNIGEIKFWGHEFSITSKNFVGAFKWNTNFNISFNRNKVTKLADGIDRVYGSFHITKVGEPFGQFYGLVKDGYYRDEAELKNSAVVPGRSVVGGIKYRDLNNDGVITNGGDKDDRTIIGNPFPDFTYGITNSIKYKNFDFEITGSGSQGNELWMRHLYSTANLDGVFNMVRKANDRYRAQRNPDGTYTTITPGAGLFGQTARRDGNLTGLERDWNSSHFIFDASFFTIKNITLGYTFNANKAKARYFTSARLYGSIQQAYVFTKYWGGNNPETSGNGGGDNDGGNLSQGVDFSNYPVPRTFTIGVNLNF